MNESLKKELPIIGIVLLPFVYLAYIWNSLPEQVPMHWNLKGEIDDWGSKYSLIGLVFLLPVLTYVLMLVVPKIDPKKRIESMGGKYDQFKFILVAFMSALALVIIYISNNQKLSSPNMIVVLVGILFVFMGNYFHPIFTNFSPKTCFLSIKLR